MTDERFDEVTRLDYAGMRRAIIGEPMSHAQRLTLDPLLVDALIRETKMLVDDAGKEELLKEERWREQERLRNQKKDAAERLARERFEKAMRLDFPGIGSVLASGGVGSHSLNYELRMRWLLLRKTFVPPTAEEMRRRVRDAGLHDIAKGEPKGHMAELADGWMPDWVKVPT